MSYKPRSLILIAALAVMGCAPNGATPPPLTQGELSDLDAVLKTHKITTAQIGIIKGGELVVSHVFGELRPGVPADEQTRLNAASITKTVTAEIAIALIEQGIMSLDEPIAKEWIDPDLEADPNLDMLTVERMLTHSSGLPNWRFFTQDGRLAVQAEPGTAYTYSGEGFQMLARFMEARTGETLAALAKTYVFEPNGMDHSSLKVDPDIFPMIAQTSDADGVFHGHFCRPPNEGGFCAREGTTSAAGNMVTTVEDYTRLLMAAAQDETRQDGTVIRPRSNVRTRFGQDNGVIICDGTHDCPDVQGYGLGYVVVDFADRTFIGHTGSDWSQLTMAYIDIQSGDGAMIFLNAPNQWARKAMPSLLVVVDPDSPWLPAYQAQAKR